MKTSQFGVLSFLKSFIVDAKTDNTTPFCYPTAISKTLKMTITDVGEQRAVVEILADPVIHGNQQGTIHGGLLCELADAAIGTAHSTVMNEDQSFTSLDIKVNFIRPSWKAKLRAEAFPIYSGKTITHYKCEIKNEDDKLIAYAISTVMTLNGDKAKGR